MNFVRPRRSEVVTAVSLYTLNLIDMAATFSMIESHKDEINPFMSLLLYVGPACFIFYKVLVVGILTAGLLFVNLRREVNVALLALSITYFIMAIAHGLSLFGG